MQLLQALLLCLITAVSGTVHLHGVNDIKTVCGETLNTTTGTITSPSYPDVYPPNIKCIWKIPNNPPNQVKFIFTRFDIEEGVNGTDDCNTDRLDISESYGLSVFDESKFSGSYCGTVAPEISSDWTANGMEIDFYSDMAIQKSGFAFYYFSVRNRCSFNNGNCRHGCMNAEYYPICLCSTGFKRQENGRDCINSESREYELASSNGSIWSPNFPYNYSNFDTSFWIITTIPGYRIKIKFLNFKTGDADDVVTIYDGSSTSDSVLGVFAGTTLPSPVESSGNEVFITFTANNTYTDMGFNAKYSPICGGTFLAEATEKYVYSHPEFGYSNYSGPIEYCNFYLEAPPGHNVEMSFVSFDIADYSYGCNYDWLTIYDGWNSSYPKVDFYCGIRPPLPIFRSTNDVFWLYWVANATVSGEGFSLAYKAVPK